MIQPWAETRRDNLISTQVRAEELERSQGLRSSALPRLLARRAERPLRVIGAVQVKIYGNVRMPKNMYVRL